GHGLEQLGLYVFGAAADLPDRRLGKAAVVHAPDQLVGPATALLAPQREVVVLEQEDAHAVLALQSQHLLDDLFRLAHTHHLAGGRAVERVDRAERATTDAAAARQHRQRREAADVLGAARPVRERQRVQILHQRPRPRRHDFTAAQIGDAVEIAPFAAGTDAVQELDQRLLAFVAHDAVDLGKVRQKLVVAEARIMPADGEVAGDAGGAPVLRNLAELGPGGLEDYPEPPTSPP